MKKAILVILLSTIVIAAAACSGNHGILRDGVTVPTPAAVKSGDVTIESPTAPPDKEKIELEGTINKNLNIHMSLQVKDGIIEGSYYYERYKTSIALKGSIDTNRKITIQEYDQNGAVTGTFVGWYVPGIRIEGDWSSEKSKSSYPFKLKVLNGVNETMVWGGEWKRTNTGRFNSADLVIFNETSKEFEFQIEAFSGSHNGYIDGKAEITGVRASYKDSETGANLTFVLGNGSVTVNADEKINQYHAGAGVGFDGEYKKGDRQEESSLLDLGMVESKEQETEFDRMAGGDRELFLDTAQISIEEDDLDGYRASVHRWLVRGLGGSNESIIMLMPENRICAAVIDLPNNKVKVFTNAGYIEKVPKTIDKWREGFKDLKVEFIKK